MKVQSEKPALECLYRGFKAQSWGRAVLAALFLYTAPCILPAASTAADKWPGVDETVVEKYAKEHGRQAREPLINTDQGDLLLFVFLLAGTIGGFAAGYYWRILMSEKVKKTEKEK
jgi:hypothetical protein